MESLKVKSARLSSGALPLLSVYSLTLDFVMLAMVIQIFFRREKFLELGFWIKGVADRSKKEAS
jgi:hypothetical protein